VTARNAPWASLIRMPRPRTPREPLLPKVERWKRQPRHGRHPDRLLFQGALFALHTGLAEEHRPQEPVFGSGMTRRRSLAEWTGASVRLDADRHLPGLQVHTALPSDGTMQLRDALGSLRQPCPPLLVGTEDNGRACPMESDVLMALVWCVAPVRVTTLRGEGRACCRRR
jgi:hypothetical protein